MEVWYDDCLQVWLARLSDGRIIEVTSDNADELPE